MSLSIHRNEWFYATVIGGLIPVIARFIVFLSGNTAVPFEMCEFIFFGLTMTITNMVTVGHLELEEKTLINLPSSVFGTILAILLGLSLVDKQPNIENPYSLWFNIAIIILVLSSASYSYKVNNKIFAVSRKLKLRRNK